jgi:hypothetical protein
MADARQQAGRSIEVFGMELSGRTPIRRFIPLKA